MKNKNGNNKTTKIITIEKKNQIFAFFYTIIHVCRKKNYFSRSCNKPSKIFFKNKLLNFPAKKSLITVFENRRKSIIQHCERSELRIHFEWTKVN